MTDTLNMRLYLSILLLTLSASAGDLSGHIHVTKTLTKKRVSLNSAYDRTSAIPAAAAGDGTLREELNRVVIYVENGPKPLQKRMETINQVHRSFEPEVVAVPVGSTIHFPNSDPIFHNVFSLSKAKLFDLGNYPEGQSRVVVFDEPSVVLVHCHLHPNINAAIVVTFDPPALVFDRH